MKYRTQIGRPNPEDAPAWCPYYFQLVAEDNLRNALEHTMGSALDLMHTIPELKENYQYEPGKWSVKSVLIHLIDTERFYAFRAMCSSRKIPTDLNSDRGREILARNDHSDVRTVSDIAMEFAAVRDATIALFANLTLDMLDYKAAGDPNPFTARSIGWIIAGHTIHHCRVLQKKYL